MDIIKDKDMAWVLIRHYKSSTRQDVPAWGGFISQTGEPPDSKTIIDYFPMINAPITEYSTIQEIFRMNEIVAKSLKRKYTITTSDLGACMRAYPVIWNNPDKYKHQIIMIGTFHLICAYLKTIGKKMEGTGFSDILIEAGLIGSSSLKGVMSGKHYERSLNCHKTVLESLERLLLQICLEKNDFAKLRKNAHM